MVNKPKIEGCGVKVVRHKTSQVTDATEGFYYAPGRTYGGSLQALFGFEGDTCGFTAGGAYSLCRRCVQKLGLIW